MITEPKDQARKPIKQQNQFTTQEKTKEPIDQARKTKEQQNQKTK